MIFPFSSIKPWRLCHCHCWSTRCGIGIGNKKTMLSMRKKGILPAKTDWMGCGRAIFIENSKREPEIMQSIHNGMAISLTRRGTFSLLYARQNWANGVSVYVSMYQTYSPKQPKGRPKGSKSKPQKRTREQELEERCCRLETEVAYLKKLRALVEKDEL